MKFCQRHQVPQEIWGSVVEGSAVSSFSSHAASEAGTLLRDLAALWNEHDPASIVFPGPGFFDLGQWNRIYVDAKVRLDFGREHYG